MKFQIKQLPFLHLYFTADEEMVVYDEENLKTTLLNTELSRTYQLVKSGSVLFDANEQAYITDNQTEELARQLQQSINILIDHNLIEQVA